MDEVGVPQFTEQQRPVGELRSEGPEIFDTESRTKRCRRLWVDCHEPRVEVWISGPRADETIGLDCLTAKNLHRGGDDRYSQTFAVIRYCHVPERCELCKSRARMNLFGIHSFNDELLPQPFR